MRLTGWRGRSGKEERNKWIVWRTWVYAGNSLPDLRDGDEQASLTLRMIFEWEK